MKPLEMWAGLECTLNRVHDRFVDQSVKNGHYERLEDLQLFAELGVKKLRYPCLWEKVAPDEIDRFDWTFLDERLVELKRLGITPIAGFLHHGSGPRYTSLIDPEFPEKLARYARAFAERYPWIEDYTPVNEINTTARFSCLYGHWFPHHQSDASYLRAVYNQVKGTILAMKAIREINPNARLIQTDDLGRAQSTTGLSYQADFENERRWLGWDFLCGEVGASHPLYKYIRKKSDLTESELSWVRENKCAPDVIGINHYLLSNRFLDHRIELYPEWTHGGNGVDQYSDVGAVDTGQATPPAPHILLQEAWARFHIPVAVTEVHTMGHRDSQMRWLYEMWSEAKIARENGANVIAITAWSLLGTFDWHNLCTSCEGMYEPGVFDLRSPDKTPRQTGLSRLIKELSSKGNSDHPILKNPGWWRTSRRILWAPKEGAFSAIGDSEQPPLIITGATGTLGQAFARICGQRNISYRLLSRAEMDISNISQVREVLQRYKPWAVINAAGYVRVDEAEEDAERCFRENVDGPFHVAAVCAERGIPVVHFSSDLVFDGAHGEAYTESHQVNPMNVYGKSKAASEEKVLLVNPLAMIVRTSSFFGPWDEYNFVTNTLRHLQQKKEVSAASDMKVSPTYVPDLVNATLDLLLDGERGIVHLTNETQVSWHEFAQRAVDVAKTKLDVDPSLIIAKTSEELALRAPRPKNSVLSSERISMLPSLDDALKRYVDQLQVRIEGQQEMH
ncbi:MAG: dTDP-4-dehydrorhamnose reductase [Bacteriovoracaceae bacterium]